MFNTSTTLSDFDQKFWDYFDLTATIVNASNDDVTKPPDQGFVVGIYSALLVIGAVGNISVFASLVLSRKLKSRVNLLMMHLTIADMIVVFLVIPLEIAWRTTNAWLAGNMGCKMFLVLRAFGFYLSSNVLVCISVDRFFAVVFPLRLAEARSRSKIMLIMAWLVAFICSLPQSIVFRVMRHPKHHDFEQCVSFDAFPSPQQELAYNVLCLLVVYFLPLAIITVCYTCIFYEIAVHSRHVSDSSPSTNSRINLRRSDHRPLERARRRTLRMTVSIVTVFACCWLPYATMTLWYMIDRQSAVHVTSRLQDLFFIMAVSNSCMDPLVYGTYTIGFQALKKTFKKTFSLYKTSEPAGILGSGPHSRISAVRSNNVHFKSRYSDREFNPTSSDHSSTRDGTFRQSSRYRVVFTISPTKNNHHCYN